MSEWEIAPTNTPLLDTTPAGEHRARAGSRPDQAGLQNPLAHVKIGSPVRLGSQFIAHTDRSENQDRVQVRLDWTITSARSHAGWG